MPKATQYGNADLLVPGEFYTFGVTDVNVSLSKFTNQDENGNDLPPNFQILVTVKTVDTIDQPQGEMLIYCSNWIPPLGKPFGEKNNLGKMAKAFGVTELLQTALGGYNIELSDEGDQIKHIFDGKIADGFIAEYTNKKGVLKKKVELWKANKLAVPKAPVKKVNGKPAPKF